MNGSVFLLGAAVFSAWVLGILIVMALWPGKPNARNDAFVIIPLGLLVGFGATSVTFFAASLCSDLPGKLATGLESFVALFVIGWLVYRQRNVCATEPAPTANKWTGWDWFLASLFAQAAVIAMVVVSRAYAAEPYGGWDAWAIWNLNARFMLRAGMAWPELLSAPQLGWTHPDYPRLLPATVARVWTWLGTEAPQASGTISALFAGATLWLLVAIIARLRGRTAGLVAGLILLATPFFVSFAPNQHADIPLASFMLAAVALAVLGQHWTLAGICAGLAAWTKNEGALFVFVFGILSALHLLRTPARGALRSLLAGLGVSLLPLLYFKFALAPANDLLAAPLGPRLVQLIDVSRHGLILASLARDVWHFGEWQWAPYLAMAVPFVAWRSRHPLHGYEVLVPLVLCAMLAGYYVVYLLTPQDLAWHLGSSLVRLLLQLWPLAILGWALALPSMHPVAPARPRHRFAPAIFLAANVVTAKFVLGAAAHQLATDELAMRHAHGSVISATVAKGWFGVERHDGQQWAWSGGRAILRLQAQPPRENDPVTLRFALRSLSPRTITIRDGGRVLWEGRVNDEFVRVEIPAVEVSPSGPTELEFTTDSPGVPEAATAGARALAFAVYHLELR